MNNGVSFIPMGIAGCYYYWTLRESNQIDINPWYKLNSLESLAIIYCIFIASIRTNWFFFILILKIGFIVFLGVLGWHILFNLEELKNMLIFIIREDSLEKEGENNYKINFENALIENFVFETENSSEKDIYKHEIIDPEVEESSLNIDKNLEKPIPQIDKINENINSDTKEYIEYVELEKENDTAETSNSVTQFSSEHFESKLKRITDTTVCDTNKNANTVSLLLSMMVENLAIESSNILDNENSDLIVTTENIEMNSENLTPVRKTEETIEIVPLDMNENNEEDAQLICSTENIAESMVTATDW